MAVNATAGGLDTSATWDSAEGATSEKLAWRQAAGNFEASNAPTVTTTITVDDCGQWVVQVQGCNDAGCGVAVSRQVYVKPPHPVGKES